MEGTREQRPSTTKVKKVPQWNPYCPECDDEVIQEEEFSVVVAHCPDCGTKLVPQGKCIWCGNPVAGWMVYCTGCGLEVFR